MKTNTIIAIEELREKILNSIVEYRAYYLQQGINMDDPMYGSEKEYSINSIIHTIQNLLGDVAYLVNAHNVFLSTYTYSEREKIKTQLNQVSQHLHNRNNHYVVSVLEELKTLMRIWNVRIDKRKLEGFNDELEHTRQLKASIENDMIDVKSIMEKVNAAHEEILMHKEQLESCLGDIRKQQDTLRIMQIDEQAELSSIKETLKTVSNNEQIISQNLEKTNLAKKIFDDFLQKISERESQLQQQESETSKYNDALKNFASDYAVKLEEAKMLINEAKAALNYKNAEGLSAAFSEQLEETKSKKNTIGWLAGAIIFLGITILIGVWIITGWWIDTTASTENQMLLNLIGRLSMIPFTITGSIFCANQYTKQKNLIEDYAYKTTIAKSMVAFSEELRNKDPERYAEYISTILKEIHQDPLRRRGKNADEFTLNKESTGIIENLISLLQTVLKK